MSPVYVVTTNDEADNQTSTAGAFTDLAAARAATEVVIAELNEQYAGTRPRFKGFVEEWEGGTFTAHHELRHTDRHEHEDGTVTEAGWEWWVARSSWAFTPTRDTTTTTKEN